MCVYVGVFERVVLAAGLCQKFLITSEAEMCYGCCPAVGLFTLHAKTLSRSSRIEYSYCNAVLLGSPTSTI